MNEGAEMKMTLDTPRQDMRVWRAPLIAVVLAVLALIALYWETVASMAAIWSRSETFTHGYLILPISLLLLWQRRRALIRSAPALRPVVRLPVLGRGCPRAHFASVLVIEQLALGAMIPVVVWAILGWQFTWALVFPLFFLFFAVPMGEELIPPLMDFTADFTVSMLQLTGKPVYREGTFIEIPSGHWSVVEGCSGVRYLIASVTLGCLFAYLTYRSPVRRVVFVILSFGVPIIANGLRAYMIVMIAHLSDMRLALGVDHFIYGWVFFGLVMLLLFWIGSYWREDDRPAEQPAIAMAEAAAPPPLRAASPWRAGAIVAALLPIWPARGYVHAAKESLVHASLNVPAVHDAWQTSAEEATRWRPHYLGTDAALRQSYTSGPRRVGVYLEYYRHQRQGAELINSQNYLVRQIDLECWQVADAPRTITVRGKTVQIRQAKLRSAQQDLLVWYWYWMDGDYTTNHYLAKLWDAKAKLLGETGDAAAIILATPLGAEDQEAETVLADFVNAMEPAIRTSTKTTETHTQPQNHKHNTQPHNTHKNKHHTKNGLENGLVNLINRTPQYRHANNNLTDYTDFHRRIRHDAVSLHALHKREGHDYGVLLRLWRLLRALRPDVVHSRNLAALAAQLPALLAGEPGRVHGGRGRGVHGLDGSRPSRLRRRRAV